MGIRQILTLGSVTLAGLGFLVAVIVFVPAEPLQYRATQLELAREPTLASSSAPKFTDRTFIAGLFVASYREQ